MSCAAILAVICILSKTTAFVERMLPSDITLTTQAASRTDTAMT